MLEVVTSTALRPFLSHTQTRRCLFVSNPPASLIFVTNSQLTPKMAYIAVHLTPPTKENPSVTSLSPASYLLDPSLSSPLKRKTRLESTDKTRKSLKLDPSPRPEDGTILQYYERVKESLPEDRQEVVVCLPAMGSFGEIKTELRVSDRYNIVDATLRLMNYKGLRDELQQMKDTHRREMVSRSR